MIFMLGAGYTLWANGHVRVDIFYGGGGGGGPAVAAPASGDRHLRSSGALAPRPDHAALLVLADGRTLLGRSPREGPISVGGIPAAFLLKIAGAGFLHPCCLVQGTSAADP